MSTDPYHASALSWQVVALTNQLERERDELRAENEQLRADLAAHHEQNTEREVLPGTVMCAVCKQVRMVRRLKHDDCQSTDR